VVVEIELEIITVVLVAVVVWLQEPLQPQQVRFILSLWEQVELLV
jgi:hypothetical protein